MTSSSPRFDWLYRIIARGSDFIVPFLLGGVAGAFLLVLTGAVWVGTAPRAAFLAVIVALAGAMVGVLSAWGLAARTDEIKVRRKANMTRLAIRQLRMAFEVFESQLEHISETIDTQPKQDLSALTVIMDHAQAVGELRPDFDELVETPEDMKHATAVGVAFHWAIKRLDLSGAATLSEGARRDFIVQQFVQGGGTLRLVKRLIRSLKEADAHFERRSGATS